MNTAQSAEALGVDVCRILVSDVGYRLAWVGLVESDANCTVSVLAQAGYDDGYLEAADIRWSEHLRGQGPTGRAIRQLQPVVARDILSDPRYQPWRSDALARGYRSSIALPLIRGSAVIGALNVYAAQADAFADEERALLDVCADTVAMGLGSLRDRHEVVHQAALRQALWDATPDLLFVHGRDGLLVDVNPRVCELYGRTREQMLSTPPEQVMGEDQPVDEAIRRVIAVLDSGLPDDFEWVARRADGSEFPVEVRLRRFVAAGGARVLAVVRDLTDRKHAEREQRNIERLGAIGVLAGGVAHDFNNLIGGIMGNLELAQRFDNAQPVAKSLEVAIGACERAASLTRQLLALASGGHTSVGSVDLAEVVEQTATFCVRGRGVDLVLRLDDGLWAARGEQGEVGQVVQNIVLNALHAMGDAGGRLQVQASNIQLAEGEHVALPAGDYVLLQFQDDGPGIPEHVLPHVFDPWVSTKAQGSGLGLATSFSILYRHGGHLSAANRGGACFSCWWPRAEGGPLLLPDAVDASSSLRVLVMDDEPMMRTLVARILEAHGHRAVSVADGAAALAAWREAIRQGAPFHLAIFDLTVPGGLGGQATLDALRLLDPHAKVIASTGYSESSARGFDALVPKPYKMAELMAAVNAVVAG